MREALLPLSRKDFLSGAPLEASQRVQIAVTLLGEVPRPVFTGELAPRHTQRRARPSAAELRLLREASLTAELAEVMGDAAGPGVDATGSKTGLTGASTGAQAQALAGVEGRLL